MDILTQEQMLLNAQARFDALKKKIVSFLQACGNRKTLTLGGKRDSDA